MKWPERHFKGKVTRHRAGTIRCIHCGYTLQPDDNKSDLTLFCVLVYTHTLLPVLQACGPQVWGTKCHLLRSGWQKSPGDADTRVHLQHLWGRGNTASKSTAFPWLGGRRVSQQGNGTENVPMTWGLELDELEGPSQTKPVWDSVITQATAKGSCSIYKKRKKWCPPSPNTFHPPPH